MEERNTKKDILEEKLKPGTGVEIVPLGEITYAGEEGNKLEFIDRIDKNNIISLLINKEKICLDGSRLWLIYGWEKTADQEIHQKGLNDSYEIKDEILRRAKK